MSALRLGVNIDHVATVREARGGAFPDPVRAAILAANLSRLGERLTSTNSPLAEGISWPMSK